MYHPYFRGKQYELVTIRENARLLREAGFVPIIEPVKESTDGLERALDQIRTVDGECVVIVNPQYGEHANGNRTLCRLVADEYGDFPRLSAGVLLAEDTSVESVRELCDRLRQREVTVVHCGFGNAGLAQELLDRPNVTRHVFMDGYCGRLYRRHFPNRPRVLVHDGFRKRANRDHPESELFSDLHVTFGEEGMDGFGDFLIVGDDYSESGGPAYAVAIHLTYIDARGDGAMYIRHFVSDRTETPSDPGGKFLEALTKLVEAVEEGGSQILRTRAVNEYLELHGAGHYPGLGYVKKLSMQHHIETLADYLAPR